MTDSIDALLARLDAYLRDVDDFSERYEVFTELGDQLETFKRRHRQEIALGLRAEGKKWKEIGAIMGGVTYQRAFQIGHGD